MRRSSQRLAVAALLGVGMMLGLTMAAAPSGATAQADMTAQDGPASEKAYGPILASDPGAAFISPADCTTQAVCDTIRFKVTPPSGLADNEDFIVILTLSWDDRKVNGTAANDLDLRVYDEPPGTSSIARAATANMPEKLTLFRPTKGTYNITVHNTTGPNTGYSLNARMTREKIDTPFESLAPDFSRPADTSGQDTATTDAPTTAPRTTPAVTSVGPGNPVVPLFELPLAEIATDSDLSSLAGRGGQVDQLLGAPPIGNFTRSTVSTPRPVSGVVLFFWAAVVPILLLGAAFAWLRTRIPAFLTA